MFIENTGYMDTGNIAEYRRSDMSRTAKEWREWFLLNPFGTDADEILADLAAAEADSDERLGEMNIQARWTLEAKQRAESAEAERDLANSEFAVVQKRMEEAEKRCAALLEKIKTWFPNYKGMCEELYGVKAGLVNWPSYLCQAKEVYDQMLTILRESKEGK